MRLQRSWKPVLVGLAICGLASMPGISVALPIGADIITVVDESGSMSGEHAFLATAIPSLESALQTAGVTSNQYGLVGFGGASSHLAGHTHLVGGNPFGTAAEFATATGSLLLNGGTEDGYSGITTALGYAFRTPATDFARQIILVTDEDRDNIGGGETFASMQTALGNAGAVLNVVVNNSVLLNGATCSTCLGLSANGTAYLADGLGGFTTAAGGSVGAGFGTTATDYVALAHATGGAMWNLNLLRAGGLTGDSFAAAFQAIKVQEIVTPPSVPEPGTLLLLGSGLAGLASWKRRKTNDA